jgi:cytochrome c biogenesis protein CcmG, thiol:disulfide interchange protein DsbE
VTFTRTKKGLLNQPFSKCFIILGLCVVFGSLFSQCTQSGRNSLAPDFTVKTLDDREITLSKLRGKVVLVDFWATWCGPCREAMPHLAELYRTYQEKGFEVIGMSVDKEDARESVSRFVKSMEVPYPVATASEEIARNYGVNGLPTSFFIDKEGRLREKIPGFNSTIAKHMAAKAAELISEKP